MSSNRLPSEWNNYCIYSGRFLPDSALSDEHVIPKSLGGNRSTVVRVARDLNSRFAHTIDAPITRDPMVQFGRRDAEAKGHSRKKPRAIWKGARAWKEGEPWGAGAARFNIEFPEVGAPKIYDTKSGKFISSNVLADTGFIIPNLQFDHVARLKFTLKTMIGVCWKMFRTDFLEAVDIELLRNILIADIEISATEREGGITYSDPFLIAASEREAHPLTKIEKIVVCKGETTMLIRELDGAVEWTVSCLGYLIGSVRVPIARSLVSRDVHPNGGIKLTVRRDRLGPELVASIL